MSSISILIPPPRKKQGIFACQGKPENKKKEEKQDSAIPHPTMQPRTSKNGNPSTNCLEMEVVTLDPSYRTQPEDKQSPDIPQVKDPRPQHHKIKVLHLNLNAAPKPHGFIPFTGLKAGRNNIDQPTSGKKHERM